jgi:hypothetical protein
VSELADLYTQEVKKFSYPATVLSRAIEIPKALLRVESRHAARGH